MKNYKAIAPGGLVAPEFGGRSVPLTGLEVTEAEARELLRCGWTIDPELPPEEAPKPVARRPKPPAPHPGAYALPELDDDSEGS